ncbi:MAG: hypothetical protein JWP72_91 [Massilia sp.]|jgi:hypothetical protein|nr:hypothetical protein [Massilia sp.]
MPRLELTDNELVVHLDKWEQLWALHGSIRVPLAKVRGATDDSGFGGVGGMGLGLRIPGTHIPFVVAAGTFLKRGDRQFVYTRRRLQTVVIELADNEWTRLVIGVPDAQAEAARINAAAARCQGLA